MRNQIIGIKEMDRLQRLKNRIINIESAQQKVLSRRGHIFNILQT